MNCCHWKFQIETCFCEVEENLIKERGKLSWSHMKNPLKEWNEDKFTTKESNTRNTCMGHHRGSQLWWKLQRSQANLYCPQTFPPCLQPWCVTIIQNMSKTSIFEKTQKHWNGIWELVTYFDKALLNLSDGGHSSFSLLQCNPRYYSLKGPKWGANKTIQVQFLFIRVLAPVPTAPSSIISAVTEIVIVIIFAAHQSNLHGFFISQPSTLSISFVKIGGYFTNRFYFYLISILWNCC